MQEIRRQFGILALRCAVFTNLRRKNVRVRSSFSHSIPTLRCLILQKCIKRRRNLYNVQDTPAFLQDAMHRGPQKLAENKAIKPEFMPHLNNEGVAASNFISEHGTHERFLLNSVKISILYIFHKIAPETL